jgi:uncharacterized protein
MDGERVFLGTGWNFPPTFSAGGREVAIVSGVEDIHQSLHILLSTRLGERVVREDFGCDMTSLLFAEVDQEFINTLTSLVSNAILLYEPRIIMNELTVSAADDDEGKLLITIDYTIPSVNSRFNMVFPFYLTEARIV